MPRKKTANRKRSSRKKATATATAPRSTRKKRTKRSSRSNSRSSGSNASSGRKKSSRRNAKSTSKENSSNQKRVVAIEDVAYGALLNIIQNNKAKIENKIDAAKAIIECRVAERSVMMEEEINMQTMQPKARKSRKKTK